MEWQYDKDGDSTAHVAVGEAAAGAMKDLCQHVLNDVLPRNEHVKWDHLLVDIYSDSGQFVVMPASTKTKYRIEKACCQVIFNELSEQYDDWLYSLDEPEFVHRIEIEERKLFDLFLEAARETDLRGLRVIFIGGGIQDEPLEDVTV